MSKRFIAIFILGLWISALTGLSFVAKEQPGMIWLFVTGFVAPASAFAQKLYERIARDEMETSVAENRTLASAIQRIETEPENVRGQIAARLENAEFIADRHLPRGIAE